MPTYSRIFRDDAKEVLGRLLRERRQELELSPAQAGGKIDADTDSYRRWESGRQLPQPRRWPVIAGFLGLGTGDLVSELVHEELKKKPVSLLMLQRRIELRLESHEAAKQIGIAKDTYRLIESGAVVPNKQTLAKLVPWLEATYRALLLLSPSRGNGQPRTPTRPSRAGQKAAVIKLPEAPTTLAELMRQTRMKHGLIPSEAGRRAGIDVWYEIETGTTKPMDDELERIANFAEEPVERVLALARA